MLWRALTNRINGGTDTQSKTAPSFQRHASGFAFHSYPNLPKIILRLLLSTEAMTIDLILRAPQVFTALEMVERFGIPSVHNLQIQEAIVSLMAHPSWALRDKAAKALGRNLSFAEIVAMVEQAAREPLSDQNALHGHLLCMRWNLAQYDSQRGEFLPGSPVTSLYLSVADFISAFIGP